MTEVKILDTFKVGNKVKISDYYQEHYPSWKVADKTFTITKLLQREVNFDKLEEADYARYRARYGKLSKFPLITLFIKHEREEYVVSQFGADPV